MKIAIIGSGAVAQTLAKGFASKGHSVMMGNRTPAKLADFQSQTGIATSEIADAVAFGEIVILAVKGSAAEAVMKGIGSALAGKVVIDTTNPIADGPPEQGILRFFTGPNDSLMERLQALAPDAKLVKAWNSIGSPFMVNPTFAGGTPTMFFCGNDPQAKETVAAILVQFGFTPEDVGTAVGARALEPLCQLWCAPGFLRNQWSHAFHLLKA